MRIGLVGWCSASGNGGMNLDIYMLAEYVTKWLIPDGSDAFPIYPNYLTKARAQAGKKVYVSELSKRPDCIDEFFEDIDAILYVEHPVYRLGHFGGYCIVSECYQRSVPVFGIPMWEWWPKDAKWSLLTSKLWCVTDYTREYITAMSTILKAEGRCPAWQLQVSGNRWGINTSEFRFTARTNVKNIVFVNGNGGYKDRKAGDLVLSILPRISPSLQVSIYSQKAIANTLPSNVNYHCKTLLSRHELYESGDLFLFPSYWEGLCHGLYEASYSGALVITTNSSPMNECVPSLLLPISEYNSVILDKPVKKAIASAEDLLKTINTLSHANIEVLSRASHEWVKANRDLRDTLQDMHRFLIM